MAATSSAAFLVLAAAASASEVSFSAAALASAVSLSAAVLVSAVSLSAAALASAVVFRGGLGFGGELVGGGFGFGGEFVGGSLGVGRRLPRRPWRRRWSCRRRPWPRRAIPSRSVSAAFLAFSSSALRRSISAAAAECAAAASSLAVLAACWATERSSSASDWAVARFLKPRRRRAGAFGRALAHPGSGCRRHCQLSTSRRSRSISRAPARGGWSVRAHVRQRVTVGGNEVQISIEPPELLVNRVAIVATAGERKTRGRSAESAMGQV